VPQLLLGPILRFVSGTEATLWVEADGPCEVEVLGRTARTFCVGGHHYGLVVVDGLEPGTATPYEVALDGRRCWPLDDGWPPSTIRTPGPGEALDVVFGSCRVALPHEGVYTEHIDDDERGRGPDALLALALRLRDAPPAERPHLLLLLGDQVYADEVPPDVLERIAGREDRHPEAPDDQVADFHEYCWLYQDAWADPATRWTMSTVPTAMVWDDHDMHDDWNISASWVADMRALPWWEDRITGGIAAYWVHQHLGNLSPAELAEDRVLAALREAEDGLDLLLEHAHRADREVDGARWSFSRDLGGVRVVVVDSRAGRVLDDPACDRGRAMLDEHEFSWLEEELSGGAEHVLVATSLPLLLLPALHDLEAWNEAVCDGAWGRLGARVGERVRRAGDLEHWAAFGGSFVRFARLLEDAAAGRRGPAPRSIVVVSGDVHHAYVAQVGFRRGAGATTPVHQVVCSPLRNPLARKERAVLRFAASGAARAIGRALTRSARVPRPPVDWRVPDGPWFDNQVATLRYADGERPRLRLFKTLPDDREPVLEAVLDRAL
jgi:hypothetical protein